MSDKTEKKDKNSKKEIFKMVASGFGTFVGTAWASNSFGEKIHADYGKAIVGTGLAVGGTMAVKELAKTNPSIALGIITGSGMNAVFQIARTEVVKSKLPSGIQSMLSGQEIVYMPLAGTPDEELRQDQRVLQIASEMAGREIDEYQDTLSGLADQLAGNEAPNENELSMAGLQEQLAGEDDYLSGDL